MYTYVYIYIYAEKRVKKKKTKIEKGRNYEQLFLKKERGKHLFIEKFLYMNFEKTKNKYPRKNIYLYKENDINNLLVFEILINIIIFFFIFAYKKSYISSFFLNFILVFFTFI